MPFAKTGKRFTKGKRRGQKMYRSPSGRTFNIKQVRMYYARGGTFKKPTERRVKRRKRRRSS